MTSVKTLPPKAELESKKVLKKLASAHRYLAELKGLVSSIPDQAILINTLALQEAKDSSEIENIITTHDELYKATMFSGASISAATKEVQRYAKALKKGFYFVQEKGLILNTDILKIHEELEQNDAGFRKLPGTELRNEATGKTIYTPPQSHDEIVSLMGNLEQFINDDDMCDVDPLIKMAVMHIQFETIHPFYDGNGRTGRILNILYLVNKGLLDIPVLYLSRYITQNKSDYYKLLQKTRETDEWEDWIYYMLEGIESTAKQTIYLVRGIKDLMMDYKHRIRSELPKIYSQDLINNLFQHPYTKIEFLEKDLNISRITARKRLEILTEHGFLEKQKFGKYNYYINVPLMKIFKNVPDVED